MSDAAASPPGPPGAAGEGGVALPASVRRRVVEWAADRLGRLEPAEVPRSLQAVARFTPVRRARAGAAAIAAALESDAAFRASVLAAVHETFPELVEAVRSGTAPPAAPPDDVAAVAYLARPEGWERLVAAAADEAAAREADARVAAAEASAARLEREVADARAAARAAEQRVAADVAELHKQVDDLRRRLRAAGDRAARAEGEAAAARAEVESIRAESLTAVTAAETELRRLRRRAEEAEAAAETVRRAARESRNADDVRLYLLLDTLVQAAQGLRRELALAPPSERPGDLVGQDAEGSWDLAARAHEPDDPARVDQLLALPNVHLVVDGYNVTKAGYPTLSLEQQRTRLVTGLAGLAARTGAEVTVVFDGAAPPRPVLPAGPRQVRVRFSPEGEIADELIRRLVAAEPPGRVVVVVTADREVSDDVRRAGARVLAPGALLRRLDRA